MRAALCSLLVLFLAFASAQAKAPWPEAGEQVRGQVDAHGWPVVPDLSRVGRGERVPRVEVATILPLQGEVPLDTIARAGRVAEDYTRHAGFEACAIVCQNEAGQAALRLTTNFSHVACTLRQEQASCPAGFAPTLESLHTHPFVSQVRANPVDAVFTGQRRGRRIVVEPHGFSDQDYQAGPGYLVAMGRLLYQEGPGTARHALPSHEGLASREPLAP